MSGINDNIDFYFDAVERLGQLPKDEYLLVNRFKRIRDKAVKDINTIVNEYYFSFKDDRVDNTSKNFYLKARNIGKDFILYDKNKFDNDICVGMGILLVKDIVGKEDMAAEYYRKLKLYG